MNPSTPIFFVLFPRVYPLFRSSKSRSYIRKLNCSRQLPQHLYRIRTRTRQGEIAIKAMYDAGKRLSETR
jgi:hypothetical protein